MLTWPVCGWCFSHAPHRQATLLPRISFFLYLGWFHLISDDLKRKTNKQTNNWFYVEIKYKGPKDMLILMNIAIFRLKKHTAMQAFKTHSLYLPFPFLSSLLNSVRSVYLYGLCSIPVSQEHVFYTCPQVESERRDWESHSLNPFSSVAFIPGSMF